MYALLWRPDHIYVYVGASSDQDDDEKHDHNDEDVDRDEYYEGGDDYIGDGMVYSRILFSIHIFLSNSILQVWHWTVSRKYGTAHRGQV